jgi:hypothetical protein
VITIGVLSKQVPLESHLARRVSQGQICAGRPRAIETSFTAVNSNALVKPLAQPQRIADTRVSGGAIASGTSRCFQVGGLSGIPADAVAVVLNITSVGQTTNGWVNGVPSRTRSPGDVDGQFRHI